MRVLIIHQGIYVYGGAELVIVRLANFMSKLGIYNALLTTSILKEVEEDLKDTEIIIHPKSKISLISKIRPLETLRIRELLSLHKGLKEKLNEFDIINVHNYPSELSIFPFHKPVVWMCNEPYLFLNTKLDFSLSLRRIINRMLLTFDKFVVKYYIKNVVVADEFNANRFKEIYNLTPHIIQYGIDFDFFSQPVDTEGVKRKYNLYNSFVILQVGMFNPFKNQIASVKVVEELKDKIKNIKLILAGFGGTEHKNGLKKYVKEKRLTEKVIFTGNLSREEIKKLYYTSNLLLHPVKLQGGWLSPFEALCAEKPIIVSHEMTASDIIKKEGIGIVTKNYAEVIFDLYNNPNKYSQMAKKGKKWVKNNLSWDKFCQKMIELFQNLISSGGGK